MPEEVIWPRGSALGDKKRAGLALRERPAETTEEPMAHHPMASPLCNHEPDGTIRPVAPVWNLDPAHDC